MQAEPSGPPNAARCPLLRRQVNLTKLEIISNNEFATAWLFAYDTRFGKVFVYRKGQFKIGAVLNIQ